MLGKYERLDVLGRGVSGIVYLAKDTLLNKQVALKEVDVQAGDLRRFLEEARVMDRLRHPNIVRVNSVDRIDNKIVIDMEYIRGQNLQETLRATGTLPLGRALDIAIQVLSALEYAHGMQTVHRDIKPANILLTTEGMVKLADFGLAEILTTNAYAGGAGTYAYMAPEDFAEENHSDNQSDIWAVGITLFEMLTAQRPFVVQNAKSPFAWKRALEQDVAIPLSDVLPGVPPQLSTVVARSLARDKEQRYHRASEFEADLINIRGELTASDYRDAPVNLMPPVLQSGGYGLPSVGTTATSETNTVVALPSAENRTEAHTIKHPVTRPIEPTSPTKRAGILGLVTRNAPAQMNVTPEAVDFGSIRLGDSKSLALNVKVSKLRGSVGGAVSAVSSDTQNSEWISCTPHAFEGSRQAVTVTVATDALNRPGDYSAQIQVSTRAGTAEVPVHVTVLSARPTFTQIAFWFVPLFCAALAPVIVTAAMGDPHKNMAPPAAASSLFLGLMLLIVSAAADIGFAERIACGVMMACMCVVLGANTAAASRFGYNGQLGEGISRAFEFSFGLGLVAIAQLVTANRWKFWGLVILLLGLALSAVCFRLEAF